MGLVYEAEHDTLHCRVALKVMQHRLRSDRVPLRRFHVEARSAAKLHHTNIVPVFDFGEQDGVCYYAMQFVNGFGMHQVIDDVRRLRGLGNKGAIGKEQPYASEQGAESLRPVTRALMTGRFVAGPAPTSDLNLGPTSSLNGEIATSSTEAATQAESLPVSSLGGSDRADMKPDFSTASIVSEPKKTYYREVARLGAQVADALDYAHGKGVIHRDIKPSNLMLDAFGNIWVTDFGLAKFVEGEDVSQSQVAGTLRFMAPERFHGVSDPRGDVYALGATLYELLTLQAAFPGRDQLRLLHQIGHDAPQPPRRIDPEVPRDLETIVLKALAKNPHDRFKTAGAMRDELIRFVNGRPSRIRPVPFYERFLRWCQRDPWLAAANIVSVLLVVILSLVSWQLDQTNNRISEANRNLAKAKERANNEAQKARTAGEKAKEEAENTKRQELLARSRLARSVFDQVDGLWRTWPERGKQLLEDANNFNVTNRDFTWWHYERLCDRLHVLQGHQGVVNAVTISSNGKTLASAGEDRIIRLWDVATGHAHAALEGHERPVHALAFSPDGKTLASAGGDSFSPSEPGELRFWDVATGQARRRLQGARGPCLRGSLQSRRQDPRLCGPGPGDSAVGYGDRPGPHHAQGAPDPGEGGRF